MEGTIVLFLLLILSRQPCAPSTVMTSSRCFNSHQEVLGLSVVRRMIDITGSQVNNITEPSRTTEAMCTVTNPNKMFRIFVEQRVFMCWCTIWWWWILGSDREAEQNQRCIGEGCVSSYSSSSHLLPACVLHRSVNWGYIWLYRWCYRRWYRWWYRGNGGGRGKRGEREKGRSSEPGCKQDTTLQHDWWRNSCQQSGWFLFRQPIRPIFFNFLSIRVIFENIFKHPLSQSGMSSLALGSVSI